MSQVTPYSGGEPFIFICYSHRDAADAVGELQWLTEQGLNVWYDNDIKPRSEWSEDIARKIEEATHFVFFATPDSVDSDYCRGEINFARELGKDIIVVYLRPTTLSGGLKVLLGPIQAIHKYEISEADYHTKLLLALDNETGSFPIGVNSRTSGRGVLAVTIILAVFALTSGILSWWYTTSTKQDATMTVNYQSTPVRHAIQEIADIADRNLVASDEIGGEITFQLHDVSWREVLETVAVTKGYEVRVTENVIFIGPDIPPAIQDASATPK